MRLGEHDFDDPFDGTNPEDINILNSIIYPDFSGAQAYHDLVLFELEREATFSVSRAIFCF